MMKNNKYKDMNAKEFSEWMTRMLGDNGLARVRVFPDSGVYFGGPTIVAELHPETEQTVAVANEPDPPALQAAVNTPFSEKSAKNMGYSGQVCPKCQGTRVRWVGKCQFCDDCQESIGGCS